MTKNQTRVRIDGNTGHRAAVITPDGYAFGNGAISSPEYGRSRPQLYRDPARILALTDPFVDHSVIVVDGASVEDHAAGYARLKANTGWECSKVDAWTLYHREGRTVSIGLRDAMTPDVHFGTLFDKRTDPGVLAMLLDRYHLHTGSPWRGTAATSALNAIRLTWENTPGKPLWRAARNGPGYMNGVGAMHWERGLGEWERTWGLVHTFDTNNAYLAAAINADVARSSLVHTGQQMFDKALPGYWLLQLDTPTLAALRDPMRPPLIEPRAMLAGGLAWVTTPYAKLLEELGDRIEVVDSWTAGPHPSGGPVACRVFRRWGETIRDGVAASRGMAWEQAVKATYKDMPGALQRESMRIHRVDWAHIIIDLARANLYRKILAIHAIHGVWPVRVSTDSLSYADTDVHGAQVGQHWISQLPIRTGLGGFKHEATHTTAEWMAR